MKLIEDFNLADSNGIRRRAILRCIAATEFANEGRFKEALKEIEWVYKQIVDRQLRRRKALVSLKKLVNNRGISRVGSLLDFHEFVHDNIWDEIAGFRAGPIHEFYQTTTYRAVAVCVGIVEDQSSSRTIHKAKGDEFDNLLLVLEKNEELDFLLTPRLDQEKHRLRYVAISRARNRLFINVPKPIGKEVRQQIIDRGLWIEELAV